MACLPPTTTTNHRHYHHHHHHHKALLVANSHNMPSNSTLSLSFLFSSNNLTSSSPMHLHRSFLPLHSSNPIAPSRRCFAASPTPPPPPPPQTPGSEPPFNENTTPSTGLGATLSRFQDRMQIFFSVLFWMSLFFWACAWDGRDDGRPNKGSRFRR